MEIISAESELQLKLDGLTEHESILKIHAGEEKFERTASFLVEHILPKEEEVVVSSLHQPVQKPNEGVFPAPPIRVIDARDRIKIHLSAPNGVLDFSQPVEYIVRDSWAGSDEESVVTTGTMDVSQLEGVTVSIKSPEDYGMPSARPDRRTRHGIGIASLFRQRRR